MPGKATVLILCFIVKHHYIRRNQVLSDCLSLNWDFGREQKHVVFIDSVPGLYLYILFKYVCSKMEIMMLYSTKPKISIMKKRLPDFKFKEHFGSYYIGTVNT